VPLDQVIFVGDGTSDMPAFRLMNERDGMAVGVFVDTDSAEEGRGHDEMHEDRRVQNLTPANYSNGSELMRSLRLAVESIGKRIALRKMSAGEKGV
jgi:trehalose-6-phosphatase